MHIVHIASECSPIAKVGGLADVVFGLSKELTKLGHRIDILLPKYHSLKISFLKDLKIHLQNLWLQEETKKYNNTIWSAQLEELNIFLVEPHPPNHYFNREEIYGFPDDVDRFFYFSKISLEYLSQQDICPDVIHLHDWPTSAAALLCKKFQKFSKFKKCKIVLTIHNLSHQGKCQPFHLSRHGLKEDSLLKELQDPYDPHLINLMKAGIIYSDEMTTVSPTYAEEIKEPLGGFGLNPELKKYEYKLTGILNGVDYSFWDPEKDSYLICPYNTSPPFSTRKIKEILNAKKMNREHLRIRFEMKQKKVPLVGVVTRLVEQKGPSLLKTAILRTLEKGAQFILLGSGAQGKIKEEFLDLKQTLLKDKNAIIYLEHDESLAHLIFAASDCFIIPSLFEPCGLTQMIAIRYGTIPIVHKTGGLADTVFDIDTSEIAFEKRNGFTFDYADDKGVFWALDRAFQLWTEPEKWHTLMKQSMNCDFSWTQGAQKYLKVYTKSSLDLKELKAAPA